MNGYTNGQLYNCCHHNQPPCWSDFKHLTVGGCATEVVNPEAPVHLQETETIGCLERSEAEFFTVYGFYQEHVAITDVPSLDEAEAIANKFSQLSGLPVYIDC
ncbi:MAG: hypothetical protein ACFHHU_00365 [Porticoccaceae bacterium]